jgi:ribose 5-phosphate isomerase A
MAAVRLASEPGRLTPARRKSHLAAARPLAENAPMSSSLERVATVAMQEVRDGMRIGLGTGRAAEALIRALGAAVAGGLRARCVTTSVRSETLAASLGIELVTLDDVAELDVAFDGADEVSPTLDLVKGLGGALLRERVVAHAAERFVVLVGEEKLVPALCTRAPVPVEVVPFARAPVERALERAGARPVLRTTATGEPYRTDNHNLVVDAHFAPLADPNAVEARILAVPGVVDTGLFLGMAHEVLVASASGVERRVPRG